MIIDASIPLRVMVPQMNLAEIMLQAERYKVHEGRPRTCCFRL